jgi:hypothetical protein
MEFGSDIQAGKDYAQTAEGPGYDYLLSATIYWEPIRVVSRSWRGCTRTNTRLEQTSAVADDEIELLLEQLRDEIVTWRRYEWLVGYRPIRLAVEAARFIRRSMRGLTQRTKSVRVRRNAARNR